MKLISKHILLAGLSLAFLQVPSAPAHAQSSNLQKSQDLQDALRRIARNSNDSSALADAGLAALAIGDTRAAIGFLARADEIYPRSGRVKAGLGRALLEERNPFGALRYFDQALSNGIALREIASDRGLAFDLIGRNEDAQKDYKVALQYDSSDELLARYAISLGISGDLEQSDLKLNPLLQKSDRDAWRNRAFILAMNGKTKDANAIARQTMQKRMARAIKPFFDRMPKLTAAQKAAAVHFGHFPASENIGVDVASVQYAARSSVRGGDGADAGLIPLGEPLGATAKKPRVLAMPDTSPRRRPGQGGNSVARKLGKEPVEIVLLDRKTLPAPGRRSSRSSEKTEKVDANSRKGRRLLRQAARDGSEEAKALLAKLEAQENAKKSKPIPEPKPVEIKLASVSVPEKKPMDTSKPASPKTGNIPKPGFQTAVGQQSDKVKKPAQLASAETRKPDIISASVERRVAIGNRPPSIAPKPVQKAPSVALPPEAKKPVQLVNFDLGKSVSQTPEPAKKPIQIAQASEPKKSLADIIGSISIPEEEKKATVVPVDLEKITPAKKQVAAKRAPVAEKPKADEKKEEHPKRYWVQLATGSNISALKYDFRRMKKKNTALFGDMSGWTSPWGRTRRMVVGPFDDLASAKKFDSTFRKNGGDSFAWVSKKGTEVTKLP